MIEDLEECREDVVQTADFILWWMKEGKLKTDNVLLAELTKLAIEESRYRTAMHLNRFYAQEEVKYQ